jgi:hypothetical protein
MNICHATGHPSGHKLSYCTVFTQRRLPPSGGRGRDSRPAAIGRRSGPHRRSTGRLCPSAVNVASGAIDRCPACDGDAAEQCALAAQAGSPPPPLFTRVPAHDEEALRLPSNGHSTFLVVYVRDTGRAEQTSRTL